MRILMRNKTIAFALFTSMILLALLATTGCRENGEEKVKTGLSLDFSHVVGNSGVVFNAMNYTNAAGNPYEVTEIMYFISDLKLYHQDGRVISFSEWEDIHYVDTNYPGTLSWKTESDIPEGRYDSIRFTFGISSAKNQSFMFVNPPEVNMAWPEVLGGGYHYLMLNGWWNNSEGVRSPFNFHLGIGQIYENNSGNVNDITGFIDNSFGVTPAGDSFTIVKASENKLTLVMDVNSWFDSPEVFDLDYFGGAIMQNQEAMQLGCRNGADAFRLE